MLRTYFVRQWFNLSDPGAEELLYESAAVRNFVGVDLGIAPAPDETTILRFRWFVGLGMDDGVWNHAVFSKNRNGLLTSEVAQRFFSEINRLAKRFMSDEHFTVDGTLIQAWASQKSFRKKDGSDDGDGTTFMGKSGRTRPISRPPIRRRVSTRKAMARSRSWPIPVMRWSRNVTA